MIIVQMEVSALARSLRHSGVQYVDHTFYSTGKHLRKSSEQRDLLTCVKALSELSSPYTCTVNMLTRVGKAATVHC